MHYDKSTGTLTFMEHSAFEVAVEVPMAARSLELLHQMIDARGAATCAAWSEEEFGESGHPPLLARPASALDAHGCCPHR